jgi:hypothetical protein
MIKELTERAEMRLQEVEQRAQEGERRAQEALQQFRTEPPELAATIENLMQQVRRE